MLNKTERLVLAGDYRIIRGPTLDQVVVELPWTDDLVAKSNVSNTICSWRYRMNSVYDPDPVVLSGGVAGLSSWSNQYGYYRVLAFKYDITVINRDDFPIVVSTLPSNEDYGANSVHTPSFGEIKYGKVNCASASGGQDKAHFSGTVHLASLYGKNYLFDNSTHSSVNASPGFMLYFHVGYQAPTAITNGVVCFARLTYVTIFYDRVASW